MYNIVFIIFRILLLIVPVRIMLFVTIINQNSYSFVCSLYLALDYMTICIDYEIIGGFVFLL